MTDETSFDLSTFLPYLLSQAAETVSHDFQQIYKSRYCLLRTEWRVLFHVGHYGRMTAKDICSNTRMHKTKVSRAVKSLETRRMIHRTQQDRDRRFEWLSLTRTGEAAFVDLRAEAQKYDAALSKALGPDVNAHLREALRSLNLPRG